MKPVKFKAVLVKMGSWTVAITTADTKKLFNAKGYIRVKGTIDGHAIKGHSLMPRKEGNHCMAIKAGIRKAIKKEAGDTIVFILEKDTDEMEIPVELQDAFEASPEAKQLFDSDSYSNKKYFVEHINEAKSQATKDRRAVESIMLLEKRYREKHNGNKS